MQRFCKFLREHGMKTVNFKKKKSKLFRKKLQESYENSQICYICTEKIENKYFKDKKYCKFRNHI